MKLLAVSLTGALAVTLNLYPAGASTAQDLTQTRTGTYSDQGKANSGVTEQEADDLAAKDMFRRQLSVPEKPLNVGIQYWIELKKPQGKALRANNKTVFHGGDQVRFHFKPNIDGYAYIVMKSGSTGQKAVLFPDAAIGEENKITHGQEIVLPPGGDVFEFDKNPGMENLILLVSRQPIDPTIYVKNSGEALAATEKNKPQLIAMNAGGKDLIPGGVFVSYAANDDDSKGIFFEPMNADMKTATLVKKSPYVQAQPGKHLLAASGHKPTAKRAAPIRVPSAATVSEAATVTLVSNDVNGVLSAEIFLHHY